MFRLHFGFTATISCLLTVAISASASAQNQPENGPAPAQAEPSPELWKLLSDWAAGSAAIKTLSGEHERHVYDDTFHVEKVSNGKFFYEGPDKGRIDITDVQITPDMINRRNTPGAKVERSPDGKPYELKSDDNAKWICDGSKIFEIDDAQKQARVVNLPPTLRGANIMNSPLPFLFGLPPRDALARFNMTLVQDARPQHEYVLLSALPRLRQDADNWSSAEIFLDTRTFLPLAVRLVDPPKTKRTTYKFKDTKINDKSLINWILREKPFEPNLRGYQIQVIQPDTEKTGNDVAQNKPSQPVVPDVVGKPHHVAEQMLLEAGVGKENIRKFKGQPAPRPNLKFIVSKQNPEPGTPLAAGMEVQLLIFIEPAAPGGAGPGAAAIRPTSGTKQ
ncbi:MAG: PASTA domain-containing protein [Planctomycetaceae bacterium]